MKMRKILSFVLVLSLVLGSFSMAFAATPADVVGTPNEEAVTVLMGLGVIDGYPDGTYKPENIVTRAEMAKLVVVALGLEDYAKVGTSSYPDMTGAGWAQGYVGYATSLGIVEGYPDGTFKPSATVTYPEVATMIVRALGYTDDSLLPAVWPANYVVKAKALGIFDDVTTSALGANRGDVAQMLYNALGLQIGSVDADNKWAANGNDTMLLRLGAKEYKSGEAFLVKGDESSDINLRPYVGAWATAYTVDGDIVAIYEESTFLTGFNQPGDKEFVVGDTTYKISNAAVAGEKLPYVSTTAALAAGYEGNDFFNGEFEPWASTSNRLHELDTRSSASPYTIAVDLDGNTITKVYSVAAWAPHTTTGEITKSDLKDITDDQELFGVEFILDDNDEIDLNSFDLVGVDSLSDIKVGDIVYVYPGYATDDVRRVAVGTGDVTGKVTRVNSDGDEFVIAGKALDLSHWPDGWFEATGTATWSAIQYFGIDAGETGTAKLDAYGNVYSWEVTDATADNYAIVISKAVSTNDLDSNRVKLITKAGDEVVLDINSDATGTTIGALAAGDLVVYALDSDGDIDEIIEQTWNTAGNLTLSANRTIFSNMLIDTPVVVFTSESGVGYDVTALDNVKTGTVLTSAKYLAVDSKITVMIVDEANATGTSDNVYAFINTTANAINADDDKVLELSGVSAGADYTALTVTSEVAAGNILAASTPAALYVFTVDSDGAVKFKSVTSGAAGLVDVIVNDIDGNNVLLEKGTTDVWAQIEATAFVVQYDISDKEYTVDEFDSIDLGSKITLFQISDDSIDDGTYDYVVITVL